MLRRFVWASLVLFAVAIVAIYFYRDSIARKAANAVLSDSGLTITGLSIKSIGTSTIDFDELILQTGGGTQVRVIGISLPLNARSAQSGPLRIDEVELVSSGGSAEPVPIAATLAAIIALPQVMPYSEVQISQLQYEGIAPLQNVTWESSEQGQFLQFTIEKFAIAAGVNSMGDADHRVSLTATTNLGINAIALALSVSPLDGGFEISGQSTTRLSPLIPALRTFGMLPREFTKVDALLRGSVNTTIPADPARSFTIHGSLRPDGEMAIRHAIPDQAPADLLIFESSSMDTTVQFPELSWQAGLQSGRLRFSKGALQNIPIAVSNLACTTGVICTAVAEVRGNGVELGGIVANTIAFSGPLKLLIEDRTQIDVDISSSLTFSGVQGSGFELSAVEMTGFPGATVTIDDSGWHLAAPQASFAVEGLSTTFGATGSVKLELNNIAVAESGRHGSSQLIIDLAGTSVELAGLTWKLPDVRGSLELVGNELAVEATLYSADSAVKAEASARHNLDKQSGEMEIRDALVDFEIRPLSGFLRSAPESWDVRAGTLTSDVNLTWIPGSDSLRLGGTGSIDLVNVAGNYNDNVATGFATQLEIHLTPEGQIEFSPSSARVELLDIGIPVTDIQADYQIAIQPQSVVVDTMTMKLFGGSATADGFSYSPGSSANDIAIRLDHIQLPLMIATAEFESIIVEGRISGMLPATLRDNRITISDGRIEADAPGGSIRYLASDGGSGDSELGLATRALGNFQFESLGADINYDDTGNLLVAMRMEGTNPDMDPNQPIILNLNLENNIPGMLRSLQATRSIQDILTERANRAQ